MLLTVLPYAYSSLLLKQQYNSMQSCFTACTWRLTCCLNPVCSLDMAERIRISSRGVPRTLDAAKSQAASLDVRRLSCA